MTNERGRPTLSQESETIALNVKFPKSLKSRIESDIVAHGDAANLSDWIRTACVERLERRK